MIIKEIELSSKELIKKYENFIYEIDANYFIFKTMGNSFNLFFNFNIINKNEYKVKFESSISILFWEKINKNEIYIKFMKEEFDEFVGVEFDELNKLEKYFKKDLKKISNDLLIIFKQIMLKEEKQRLNFLLKDFKIVYDF